MPPIPAHSDAVEDASQKSLAAAFCLGFLNKTLSFIGYFYLDVISVGGKDIPELEINGERPQWYPQRISEFLFAVLRTWATGPEIPPPFPTPGLEPLLPLYEDLLQSLEDPLHARFPDGESLYDKNVKAFLTSSMLYTPEERRTSPQKKKRGKATNAPRVLRNPPQVPEVRPAPDPAREILPADSITEGKAIIPSTLLTDEDAPRPNPLPKGGASARDLVSLHRAFKPVLPCFVDHVFALQYLAETAFLDTAELQNIPVYSITPKKTDIQSWRTPLTPPLRLPTLRHSTQAPRMYTPPIAFAPYVAERIYSVFSQTLECMKLAPEGVSAYLEGLQSAELLSPAENILLTLESAGKGGELFWTRLGEALSNFLHRHTIRCGYKKTEPPDSLRNTGFSYYWIDAGISELHRFYSTVLHGTPTVPDVVPTSTLAPTCPFTAPQTPSASPRLNKSGNRRGINRPKGTQPLFDGEATRAAAMAILELHKFDGEDAAVRTPFTQKQIIGKAASTDPDGSKISPSTVTGLMKRMFGPHNAATHYKEACRSKDKRALDQALRELLTFVTEPRSGKDQSVYLKKAVELDESKHSPVKRSPRP